MAPRALIPLLTLVLTVGAAAPTEAAPMRAAALSELEVNQVVDGDVVCLGGDIHLGPEAVVHGHAVAVFGSVHVEEGARVDGRVIGISSLAGLSLERTDPSQTAHLQTALRLLTAGGWLLATTLVALLLPVRLRYAVFLLPSLGWKMLVLGLMVAITLFAALVAAIGIGPGLGMPLAAAIALLFLVVKAAGLAILGAGLGSRLLARLVRRPLPLTAEVFVGVMLILMLRFVPVLGGVVWTAVTVVALGAGIFAVALAPQRDIAEPLRTAGN